jgi:hypothetical protein
MKVFISYASADKALARKIVEALRQEGLDVWYGDDEIFPGDNWAAKIAQGLEEANAMVVVLTRQALQSEHVRADISFALGNQNYAHRLVTVFAEDPETLPETEIPWILRRLKTVNLSASSNAEAGLQQIVQSLQAAA